MKIYFNSTIFRESQKVYHTKTGVVREFYDDNNNIIRREERDVLNRDTDTKWFDKQGNVTEVLHKDYYKTENEEVFVETFKSKTQEYTRKSYTKIENGLKHIIDDFHSKTTGKSYFNDFVHNLKGELIKVTTNNTTRKLKV